MPELNLSTESANTTKHLSSEYLSTEHLSTKSSAYVGRFAPSPTGPLHQGSLLAAVASYLDARAAGGKWLLRIEDVDTSRTVPKATEQILCSLEQHGLNWDGPAAFQSQHNEHYHTALDRLFAANKLFYCQCRRTDLRKIAGPYPGYCRHQKIVRYVPANSQNPASHAVRFECPSGELSFNDRLLGQQQFDLSELGDFIVRRRDSLYAYQLAVVVDDESQGITDIVRGADLLDSTPWQMLLQTALGYRQPRYAHLPLLLDSNGYKLSKQTGAAAISDKTPTANLGNVLCQLHQPLPQCWQDYSPAELLRHATHHWQPMDIPKLL